MSIKVDYHFHPNLSLLCKTLSKCKSKKIWEAFRRHKLDVVFITEHAYKRPKTSFEILKKYKPRNAKTLIVPGIECLSSEGIDMIVFAQQEKHIYSKQNLLTPWKLSIKEMVELVDREPKLFGIVVHPHTPGTTSIYRIAGPQFTHNAIKKIKFVEKHNCSFTITMRIFKALGLNRILKKKYKQMVDTNHTPKDLLPKNTIQTAGSDAHHPEEIGDCSIIEAPRKEDDDYLFKMATTKSGRLHKGENKNSILIVRQIITTAKEYFMKKLHLYKTDKKL